MAAELALALASSGMTTPFPCAIFLAYNICAGLTGLKSSFPGVSPSWGAGRLRCDLLSSTDAADLEIEHKLAKVGVEGSNPFARSKNGFPSSRGGSRVRSNVLGPLVDQGVIPHNFAIFKSLLRVVSCGHEEVKSVKKPAKKFVKRCIKADERIAAALVAIKKRPSRRLKRDKPEWIAPADQEELLAHLRILQMAMCRARGRSDLRLDAPDAPDGRLSCLGCGGCAGGKPRPSFVQTAAS
jgi:hypothetical protein